MTLLETLRVLAPVVTPGDLTTAEYTEDGMVECPVCCGDGEVGAKDFGNFDHKALGVQFYGIGREFGDHEKLWSALVNALPELIAALEVVTLVRDEDWLAERIAESFGTAPKWCALLGARAIIAALPKETDNDD